MTEKQQGQWAKILRHIHAPNTEFLEFYGYQHYPSAKHALCQITKNTCDVWFLRLCLIRIFWLGR